MSPVSDQALLGSADLPAHLRRAVDESARLLQAAGAMLYLLDESGTTLRWAYDAGIRDADELAWVRSLQFPVGVGLFGRAVSDGVLQSTADYPLDPRFVHSPLLDRFVDEMEVHSMIVAPLTGAAGAIGALGAFSHDAHAFDEASGALLTALAAHAAVAVDNARLIDELAASRELLAARARSERSLREIAARITAIRDPQAIARQVVEESHRLLQSDFALLALVDGDEIHSVVVSGDLAPDARTIVTGQRLHVRGSLLETAIHSRSAVSTTDYLADIVAHESGHNVDLARMLEIGGIAVAPLRVEERVVGLLGVWGRAPRRFDPEELELLQGMADVAAIAVDNARLAHELGTSEERYRFLIERSPDLIWQVDRGEQLVFVNDRVESLLGWRPRELIGRSALELVHEDSVESVRDRWTASWDQPGVERVFRFHLRHRDGHAVPIELRSVGIRVDGELVGFQGALRDETERERLERELRRSEERFRVLVERSPDLLWATNAEGRFTFVSDSHEWLLGWKRAELLGQPWTLTTHESSLATAYAQSAIQARDPHVTLRYRLNMRDRDGNPIPAEMHSTALIVDGEVAGYHGSARDMREFDRLERDLRESEARYRFLTEHSPDIITAVDAHGMLTYVSGRALQLTGWIPDEVVGRPFEQLIHPDTRGVMRSSWRARRSNPAAEQQYRLTLLHRNGSAIPVEVRSVGIVVDGEFRGSQASIRDMSDRDRMERELRRQEAEIAASQERSKLAQELHDSVTQALFSMTLTTRSAEMLLERDPSRVAEKLTELRELASDALAEMRGLIFELRPGSLDRDGLVTALRKHAAAVQGRTGISVSVEASEIGRVSPALEETLYRISQEALHNVVKHARATEARISLSTDPEAGLLRLSIADNGGGFDPAQVPSGHLGLEGIRARAERVAANVRIESRVGGGTRIAVTAPLMPDFEAADDALDAGADGAADTLAHAVERGSTSTAQ